MPRGFDILGDIREQRTVAVGQGIRELGRLEKLYGKGRWRKLSGTALVRRKGEVFEAEIHWYEAHGIGKHEFKIKRKL
ncbi:MAG TPA: hypothetical protein VM695_15915 [Phycisphaerae bacterium]|nr:hypothetical protein [Phycisphaerae bacterium]